MRTLVLTAAFLMTLLPTALAGESNETRPDDAAWVEDCPPDMMCAYAEDEPARGPADGSCEECRGDETPQAYGPEDCIECTPGPVDTCMDGADASEACDEDVQYIGAPADPTPIESRAEKDTPSEKPVPALAVGGILFVAAIAVAMRKSV